MEESKLKSLGKAWNDERRARMRERIRAYRDKAAAKN